MNGPPLRIGLTLEIYSTSNRKYEAYQVRGIVDEYVVLRIQRGRYVHTLQPIARIGEWLESGKARVKPK